MPQVVPTGMFFRGLALPTLGSTSGPLSTFDMYVELVAGMRMNALPFPRAHDEPLYYDVLVFQQHHTIRIVQVGVGQQELSVGFGRLRILCAAGVRSQEYDQNCR